MHPRTHPIPSILPFLQGKACSSGLPFDGDLGPVQVLMPCLGQGHVELSVLFLSHAVYDWTDGIMPACYFGVYIPPSKWFLIDRLPIIPCWWICHSGNTVNKFLVCSYSLVAAVKNINCIILNVTKTNVQSEVGNKLTPKNID